MGREAHTSCEAEVEPGADAKAHCQLTKQYLVSYGRIFEVCGYTNMAVGIVALQIAQQALSEALRKHHNNSTSILGTD